MNINRQVTAPLTVPRTNRNHAITVLSSFAAGKFVPLAYIPLLREDAVTGRINLAVEMQETAEILMNPVNMRIRAYLVPHLVAERFEGSVDQLNRSYMGQPKTVGGAVVPFIETQAFGTHGSNAVYRAMGLHGKSTDLVNTFILESYNAIWNFLAENRSPDIAKRTRLDATLAPAFWQHSRYQHIVPDFDQAVIDGEVALNVVNARMPVSGIGIASMTTPAAISTVYETSGTSAYSKGVYIKSHEESLTAQTGKLAVRTNAAATLPDIYAELAANGITVSLSNIDLARKTQAFAKLREQYAGHDEDWVVDLLMDGIHIPDQSLKQPMLLADQTVRFGMSKRYATDAGNLAESAVSGAAMASISVRVPRLHTGGIVMFVAEVLPEQLFERERDPYLHSTNVEQWPEYLRDELDPEKVEVVQNGYIDTDHATPNGTFGYAPLNHKWNRMSPNIGGKFLRPTANTAFDEDRQRLWAVETVNPALGEQFYLAKNVHQKPFLVNAEGTEPFEVTMLGNAVINGNTVFGGVLVEASNNYDVIAAKAPTARIEKEA